MLKVLLRQQLAVFGPVEDMVFSGHVDLRCTPRDDNFTTLGMFIVTCSMYELSQKFTVVGGMDTDLASVPRQAWPVVPPHRKIKRAAVLHDAFYQYRPMMITPLGERRMQRNEADALLYYACRAEDMSEDDSLLVYEAVRIGGSSTWHNHDQEFPQLPIS